MKKHAPKVRRAFAAALCIALSLCLSSCWSQKELNTLAIVLATALDAGDSPDTAKMTAQVVIASQIGSSGGGKSGGSDSKAYANVSLTGKSVLSSARGITLMQSRKLYFAHNEVLIFGNDLAKVDIAEGLDAFTRDYESRLNIYVLVARNRAEDILNEDVELEKTPAQHISGMMKNQHLNLESVVVTLRDFLVATLDESTAPVAPIIDIYEEQDKKHVRLDGTAVFKNGRMIGELDKDQTRGLLFMINQAKSGAVNVQTPWGWVVLQLIDCQSQLKAVAKDGGQIGMKLVVHADVILQSNETYEDMGTPEKLQMLRDLMKEAINKDVANTLEAARGLSADIFGFGGAIAREHPAQWEEMKDHWDEKFPQMALDTQINVEIRSTAGLNQPVVPGGKP